LAGAISTEIVGAGDRDPKPVWLWWWRTGARPGRRGPVLAGVLAPPCGNGLGRPPGSPGRVCQGSGASARLPAVWPVPRPGSPGPGGLQTPDSRNRPALRILFGAVFAVDAFLKWRPGFASSFHSQVTAAAQGQPAGLLPWFHFWAHLIALAPIPFAYLSAIIESLIALALLSGVAWQVTYFAAAAFFSRQSRGLRRPLQGYNRHRDRHHLRDHVARPVPARHTR
jgi:hypothetical protein